LGSNVLYTNGIPKLKPSESNDRERISVLKLDMVDKNVAAAALVSSFNLAKSVEFEKAFCRVRFWSAKKGRLKVAKNPM